MTAYAEILVYIGNRSARAYNDVETVSQNLGLEVVKCKKCGKVMANQKKRLGFDLIVFKKDCGISFFHKL